MSELPFVRGFALGNQAVSQPGPVMPSPEATVLQVDDDGNMGIFRPSVARKPGDFRKGDFDENLAERDELNAAGLAEELLQGVDADEMTRKGFIDQYQAGLELLGLDIREDKDSKVSKVGHPLLLEAVVRAQAAAGGEMLPAGGPVKVEMLGGSTGGLDAMAQGLQDDLNWYLTKGAPEFGPDFDRGLFGLFYSGNLLRKVYQHPLRRRPTAESIDISDLIVSENATDLETALRVTHRSEMNPMEVRRMMHFGGWKQLDLGHGQPTRDAAREAQNRIAGYSPMGTRPQDQPHEILEITADVDLADYGIHDARLPADLPLTHVVTIDRLSRKVLSVRRGWKQDDELFPRKQRYVHYGMVPAFGFLHLGFMHLLGNQTRVLRAVWRVLVTSGMYANSPGFLKAKGVRLATSKANPGPGEAIDVDAGTADDIRKAIMELPYKDVSSTTMQLADAIAQEASRLAGTVNLESGEGRTNMPVGTMMSLIEVATQVMSAVHKRMHRSQARELELLKELFEADPGALSRYAPNPSRQWSTAEELRNYRLAPASDPNVPSQVHRIQLATALVTVASQNPDLYDRTAAHKRAWMTIGVSDADSFVLPQPAPLPPGGPGAAPPDPLIGQARMMEAQAKIAKVKQDQVDSQRKAATEEVQSQHQAASLALDTQAKQAELASRERIAETQTEIEAQRLEIERARAAAEHARDLHATTTDAAIRAHEAKVSADTAKHTAQLQSQTAKHVARMKPKPKPAGGKK